MQFRVFVVLFLVMTGCLHRGADAISTAVGAIAAGGGPVADDEIEAIVAENPHLASLLYDSVECSSDDQQMFRWQITQAEAACRDAWNSRLDLPSLGPDESLAMLNAKVAYEQFTSDCSETPDEDIYLRDFWGQVWKPGSPWSYAWDGCFGTHPDRTGQYGVVEEFCDYEDFSVP